MTLRPAPLVASLLLHVALLFLALRMALPAHRLPDLIPVALIGGERGGGGESGGAPPAPAAVAPAAPAAKPAAVRRVAPVVAARPQPLAPRHGAPRRAAPPAAAAAAAVPRSESPNPSDAARLGTGNGAGSGAESGDGSGVGTGSGSGSGSGSAAGSGRGAGGGVDLRVFCLQCPEPRYPRQAVMRGWQGKVWIELALSPEGTVADASVARSSGFALLDDAAVQVARQSRFRVADRRSGLLAYTFRLTEAH